MIKNMKIKLFKILLLVLFFALFIWYVKNDGIYVVTHLFSSELDMINEYAIYDVEFSEKTIVERYEMENDYLNIPFISHSKAIKATLLVPNEEMESIIPEFAREYDLEHSLDIRTEKTDEQIQYNAWMQRTVVKWFDKTQRTIFYTVMNPSEEYTRVYIAVGNIGWNLYEYCK